MKKCKVEILNKILPSIRDKTVTKRDKAIYDKILEEEWERIRLERNSLMKYYPFAVFGV